MIKHKRNISDIEKACFKHFIIEEILFHSAKSTAIDEVISTILRRMNSVSKQPMTTSRIESANHTHKANIWKHLLNLHYTSVIFDQFSFTRKLDSRYKANRLKHCLEDAEDCVMPNNLELKCNYWYWHQPLVLVKFVSASIISTHINCQYRFQLLHESIITSINNWFTAMIFWFLTSHTEEYWRRSITSTDIPAINIPIKLWNARVLIILFYCCFIISSNP